MKDKFLALFLGINFSFWAVVLIGKTTAKEPWFMGILPVALGTILILFFGEEK